MFKRLRVGLRALLGVAVIATVQAGSAQGVGTRGSVNVGAGGDFTYEISLDVAPGPGQWQPALALRYGSNKPNGVFGLGWAFTGVSTIARCGASPAEEGVRRGVRYDANDVFCLDGQKLRSTGGAYGANGTQYRTAIDTFSRVTSLGSVGGGPQSFTVEARTGEIYTFGGSDDSRLAHPNRGVIRTWKVSELRDRFNNVITFHYAKDMTRGEQLLQEVRYGNGLIRLNYVARPGNDRILTFDDNVQYGSTDSLVQSIDMHHKPQSAAGGAPALFKTYRLGYSQSAATQRSLLTSVQECAPDGACQPKVGFTYRTGTPGQFYQAGTHPYQPSGRYNEVQYGLADFAGNGLQSLYMFRKGEFNDKILWDVDGDGRTDILTIRDAPRDFATDTEEIQYANGTVQSVPLNLTNEAGCFADINGDGRSELIRFRGVSRGGSNAGNTYYQVVEPLGSTYIELGTDYLGSCKAVDVDGDGRAELLVYPSQGSSHLLTYNGSALVKLPMTYEMGLPHASLGDFNGDGKTDWVFGSRFFDDAARSVYLSTGDGSAGQLAWKTSIGGVACVADFNGDGRSDVLIRSGKLELGNGNTATVVSHNAPSYGGVIECGDFNGDGLADLAVTGAYWYNALPHDVDRMVATDNGLGHRHTIEYKRLTDASVYTKGSGASYPLMDLQDTTLVVSALRAGNDTQGWLITRYRYQGLRSDLTRNGSLGFAQVSRRNELTGIDTTTTYHQSYPLTGFAAEVRQTHTTPSYGQVVEIATHSYAQRGIGAATATAQKAQVFPAATETLRYDLKSGAVVGTTRQTFDGHDAFGYPARERTEHLDGNGMLTSSATTEHLYQHQEATWLLGQLTRSTTTRQNLRGLPATSAPSNALTVQVYPTAVYRTLTEARSFTQALTANVKGGVGTYRFAWSLAQGSRLQISDAGATTATVGVTLGWSENLNETVRVTVTDSAGTSASSDVPVRLVTPPSTPVPIAIQLSPSAIQQSRNSPGAVSVAVTATSTGGYGRHTYAWSRISGSRIAVSNAASAAPSFSVTLGWSEALNETYRLTVTDELGTVATADLPIRFTTPPALVAVTSPSGTFDLGCGNYFEAAVTASGGVSPYSFSWSSYRSGIGGSVTFYSPASSSTEVRLIGSGSTTITATVRDAAGNASSASFNVTSMTGGQCSR